MPRQKQAAPARNAQAAAVAAAKARGEELSDGGCVHRWLLAAAGTAAAACVWWCLIRFIHRVWASDHVSILAKPTPTTKFPPNGTIDELDVFGPALKSQHPRDEEDDDAAGSSKKKKAKTTEVGKNNAPLACS